MLKLFSQGSKWNSCVEHYKKRYVREGWVPSASNLMSASSLTILPFHNAIEITGVLLSRVWALARSWSPTCLQGDHEPSSCQKVVAASFGAPQQSFFWQTALTFSGFGVPPSTRLLACEAAVLCLSSNSGLTACRCSCKGACSAGYGGLGRGSAMHRSERKKFWG